MDLQGLPRPTRRPSPALIALQFVHAMLVGVVCWGLAMTGAFIVAGGGSMIESAGVIAMLVLVLGAEFGLAAWLILRRRKVNRLIHSARLHLMARDSESARQALLQLFQYFEYRMNPAQVLFGLGVADVIEGETERALVLLRRAGNYPAAMQLRALISLSQGMITNASRLMSAVIALRPMRIESWVMLAACEQAAGRSEGAEHLLVAARQRWPRSFQIARALDDLRAGDSLAQALLKREMPQADPAVGDAKLA